MKEKLNFLIIDTSNENLTSVCLSMAGKCICKESNEERGHVKNLMPFIRDILSENSITIKQLDFISIVEGPGSWTGLRIGFATIKVLCMVNSLKLIVINNFDVFLKNFQNKNSSTEIAILINSSNLNYYYRYVLVGANESADGIGDKKILDTKYPHIEKIYFQRPSTEVFVNESLNKFYKNEFEDVDNAEPYYISTGDLKSNFVKAKI